MYPIIIIKVTILKIVENKLLGSYTPVPVPYSLFTLTNMKVS